MGRFRRLQPAREAERSSLPTAESSNLSWSSSATEWLAERRNALCTQVYQHAGPVRLGRMRARPPEHTARPLRATHAVTNRARCHGPACAARAPRTCARTPSPPCAPRATHRAPRDKRRPPPPAARLLTHACARAPAHMRRLCAALMRAAAAPRRARPAHAMHLRAHTASTRRPSASAPPARRAPCARAACR